MILFMDDDPNRAALAYQRWSKERCNRTLWCLTAAEAIDVLRNYVNELEEVHLDHDLGGETYVDIRREDCGMEVVRWLEQRHRTPKLDFVGYTKINFIVHTHNIPAGLKMQDRLQKLGLTVKFTPFGT